MYSVINVDISANFSDFIKTTVLYGPNDYRYVNFCQKSVIRGSSTVNGDSAHDTDPLAKEHNYVSFYVRSIRIRYDVIPVDSGNVTYKIAYPCYVILFKLPYKDDEDIRSKLIRGNLGGMILYSHPECVLSYDFISIEVDKKEQLISSGFLSCNKPFNVGPNDYVGVFYYCPHYLNIDHLLWKFNATAKVTFKPQ